MVIWAELSKRKKHWLGMHWSQWAHWIWQFHFAETMFALDKSSCHCDLSIYEIYKKQSLSLWLNPFHLHQYKNEGTSTHFFFFFVRVKLTALRSPLLNCRCAQEGSDALSDWARWGVMVRCCSLRKLYILCVECWCMFLEFASSGWVNGLIPMASSLG